MRWRLVNRLKNEPRGTRHRAGILLVKVESLEGETAVAVLDEIDWSACSLVEVRRGVLSGAPVLRATRMPVDAIVDNFDYGVSVAEIAEQFELPRDKVDAIVTYAQSHRVANPL